MAASGAGAQQGRTGEQLSENLVLQLLHAQLQPRPHTELTSETLCSAHLSPQPNLCQLLTPKTHKHTTHCHIVASQPAQAWCSAVLVLGLSTHAVTRRQYMSTNTAPRQGQ